MIRKIKVIIADDHPLFLDGMSSLLSDFKNISVVGKAKNGKEVLDLLITKEPDILLLDLNMPVVDGFEVFNIVKSKHPCIRIIIVSMHDECEVIADLIARGVNAYINKSEDPNSMISTIKTVMKNDFCFANNAHALAEQMKKPLIKKCMPRLSTRQLEILKMVASGKAHKNIAHELNITVRTVDYHKANLYRKLNIKSNAQLALYAKEIGILNSNEKVKQGA